MSDTIRLKLDEYLLKTGKVEEDKLQQVKERLRGTRRPLQELLIEMGIVSDEDIHSWLKLYTNVPNTSVEDLRIQEEATEKLDYKFTVQKGCLPYKIDGNDLFVAMSNPLDINAIDEMRRITGMNIRPVLIKHSEVIEAIEHVNEVDSSVYDVLKNIMIDEEDVTFVEDENGKDVANVEEGGSTNPVIRLVNLMLTDAVRMKASDIHIMPMENYIQILYRIDGILKEVMKLPAALLSRIVARIKIMSKLDIAERRVPQDGRAFIVTGNKRFDLRVSTLPSVNGEKIVIRLLDKSSPVIGIEKLKLSERDSEAFFRILDKPYGLFVVVGPTGSGKSTTLYSALTYLDNPEVNTVTVEDPVEYELKGLTQVQVNRKAGLDFPRALRSILRQDPDNVMIGEIRDHETAHIAVQASMTGHRVMSTLHTNDASSAVTRLNDLGLDRFMIASSLLGVIAQRLVRKLCPHCKREYRPDEKMLDVINDKLPFGKEQVFYQAVGCEKCNSIGFSGRMALFEILVLTERLRALILEGAGDKEIQYQALKEGMHTLFMSGLRSVYMGDTSLDEVLRVVEVTDVDILLCPNCSALVEEEWFHCVNCGEKLDFHCPNCSKPIKKSYSYCLNCGHDLEKAQPESRPEKSRSLPRELRSEKGELERPVLLAVDDDPKMLKIVELTFRDMFKTVLKAETGEEGLRLAQKHLPDLLVLDVMMPGISGFDVCRKLRGSLATSQIPVILLTAVSEEEGQEEGTEVGADDYITKPFSPDKLRSRAQMVLKGQNKLLGTPDKI